MSIKSIKILFTILSFSIYFSACTDDEIEIDSRERTFTEQARAYFEENATDIQPVRVGANARNPSRSMHLSSNLIIPDWGKIKHIENQYFSTVEVPLSGDVFTRSIYSKKQEDGKYKKYLHHISTKLIVQRVNATGEFRYFIATIIGRNRKASEELNFITPHSLSGLIIISDLEGKYLDAYQFDKGSKQRVILAHAAGCAPKDITPSVATNSFNLMSTEDADIFLRSGESGGGSTGGDNIGGGNIGGGGITEGWFCPICGSRYCNSCEVSVTYCSVCGQPVDDCRCCHDCKKSPCICSRCPTCGSKYCSGNHSGGQETPNPPTEEPEEKPTITLSVSANTITLGDSYTISAKIHPEGFVYDKIEFAIYNLNGNVGGNFHTQGNPLTINAVNPGTWDIIATLTYNNEAKEERSNSKRITILYPTINEIMNNATVRSRMDKAWQESCDKATQYVCYEFGGCIVLNTANEANCYYTLDYVQSQPYTYDTPQMTVTYDETMPKINDPRYGSFYTVAQFHTHPSYLKANPTKFYIRPVGPSTDDHNTAPHLPGILYDYIGNPKSATDTTRVHTNKDTTSLTLNITTYGQLPRREL